MDHAIPKSWYPVGTPNTAERPTAPACSECNQRLSVIEQEFRRALALQLDPNSPHSKGILDKVMNSMAADDARNEIDQRARSARKSDLLAKVVMNPSARHAFPSLQPRAPSFQPRRHVRPEQRQKATVLAVKLHDDIVQAFGEKVMRALVWHAFGGYIPPGVRIKTFLPRSDKIQSSSEMIRRLSASVRSRRTYSIPPGILMEIAKADDDESGQYAALLELRLWEHFCIFVSASTELKNAGNE